MKLKRFTLAVCFNRDIVPGFSRENAWRCISEALYSGDVDGAELYEFSKGPIYGCVLTNMRLGKSRRVSDSLARNLPVVASVDWARPFMLHNELEHFAEMEQIGTVGTDGTMIPVAGEDLTLLFNRPKRKRWNNPWREKRLLLVWPDGEREAQQIARGILSASEKEQMDRDIIVFPVEQGFLPDILLFLNDYRRMSAETGPDGTTDAAACPDGTLIFGDIGSDGLKAAAEYYSRYGFRRIVAETNARVEEDIPGIGIEYLDPSDHVRNLFHIYGFDLFSRRCDRAVAVVPDRVPADAVSLLEEAGIPYEAFRTPETESEKRSVVSALFQK